MTEQLKTLRCDTAGCKNTATRMWPNGEATSFHCWLDSMAIQDKDPEPGEPNVFTIMEPEEDRRQMRVFLSRHQPESALSDADKEIKKVSQVMFSAVAAEAKAERELDQARRDRDIRSEDVFYLAQAYRDAESQTKAAIQKFKDTYNKNTSAPA